MILFLSLCKSYWKSSFFEKVPRNVLLDTPNVVLIPPVELSCPIVKKIFWLIYKFYQKNVFFKIFFLKLFRWTCRLWFWKPCRVLLDNALNYFARKTKILKHHRFCKQFSRKVFPWTCKLRFWQPCAKCFREKSRKFLLKVRNFFAQATKFHWETIIFSRKLFRQNVLMDT